MDMKLFNRYRYRYRMVRDSNSTTKTSGFHINKELMLIPILGWSFILILIPEEYQKFLPLLNDTKYQ